MATNNALHRYAIKTLRHFECDMDAYTLGEYPEWRKTISAAAEHEVEDLREVAKDNAEIQKWIFEAKFAPVDIAAEFYRIGEAAKARKEAHRARYHVVYDTEDNCDSYEAGNNLEVAKMSALDTLCDWQTYFKPQGSVAAAWDRMIYNCSVWVSRYNAESGEYEEVWSPSDSDLRKINWVPWSELDEEARRVISEMC